MKQLLAVLAQLNVVLAGDDPERKILALVVGFEFVGMARLDSGPLHIRLRNGLAFSVLNQAFYSARGLSDHQRNTHSHRDDKQQWND